MWIFWCSSGQSKYWYHHYSSMVRLIYKTHSLSVVSVKCVSVCVWGERPSLRRSTFLKFFSCAIVEKLWGQSVHFRPLPLSGTLYYNVKSRMWTRKAKVTQKVSKYVQRWHWLENLSKSHIWVRRTKRQSPLNFFKSKFKWIPTVAGNCWNKLNPEPIPCYYKR